LIINDVLKAVPADTSLADLPMTPVHVVELLGLVDGGVISISQARQLVPEIIRTGQAPRQLVEAQGLAQISDEAALAPIVAEAIAAPANAKSVADYLGGKDAAVKALIGAVKKATQGKANAQLAEQLLRKQLEALRPNAQE